MKKILIFIVIIVIIGLFFIGGDEDTSSNQVSQEYSSKENAKIVDDDFQEIVKLSQEEVLEPSTFSLIEEAYNNGDITLDEVFGYKLVAMFDVEQLPEKYNAGAPQSLEGDMILTEIKESWDFLDEETQELFAPMFLSPEEEGAFFHPANVEVRENLISTLAQ